MPRRFITRQDIDTLADAGEATLVVDDQTTVTDIAREHARERGVRIERRETGTHPHDSTALAEDVRRAVIDHLGHEPECLDAAVHTVLSRSS